MNERSSIRFRAALDQIVSTSRWALLGFALLEVLLPRAGRAAAGLLLRYDSDVLKSLETAGSASRFFVANGLFFCSCLVVVAMAVRSFRSASWLARLAMLAALAGCGGILFRAFDQRVVALWSLQAAGALLAGAVLAFAGRRTPGRLAAILEVGIAAYAAWAIVVSAGLGARAWLDQASEILLCLGAGSAAWAAALARPRAKLRAAAGIATFLLVLGVALAFGDGSVHLLRHLLNLGNAGLPATASAALAAIAASGLVACAGPGRWFVPIAVAVICARRPEPHLIAGVLASSAMLAVTPDEDEPG